MSYPMDMYESTICLVCRPEDTEAIETADQMEEYWLNTPIEVFEKRCRKCGHTRHWWFFLRSRNPQNGE